MTPILHSMICRKVGELRSEQDNRGQKAGILGREGFTLAELLLTIAIIFVLIALAFPNVTAYLASLRQMEMDQKAQTIYTAAQNEITKLYSAGDQASFSKTAADGKLQTIPGDSIGIVADQLYYASSTYRQAPGKAAAVIVTPETLDSELVDKYWVVEYDPNSASIYAVFYSEDRNIAAEYAADISTGSTFDFLRSFDERLAEGSVVGYYGGDTTIEIETSKLAPTITPTNEETLQATVTCLRPGTVGSVIFDVKLSDAEGNVWTRTFTSTDPEMSSQGRRFVLDLVFDDLSSQDTRFGYTYGDQIWLTSNFWTQTKGTSALKPGSDLTISVVAKMQGGSSAVKNSDEVVVETNSLFAFKDGGRSDTAYVAYGRHLQNLDASSGVKSTTTKAVQISDIDFDDDETNETDWASLYGRNGSYFNGAGNFKPIVNSNLQSYDGADLKISNICSTGTAQTLGQASSASGEAALFGSVSNSLELKDMNLYRACFVANGNTAGGLVGSVSGNLSISNCCVYLGESSSEPYDDGFNQTQAWIAGRTAGGLVGSVSGGANVTIDDSFASSVVGSVDGTTARRYSAGSCDVAGGLVGSTSGSVTIRTSFSGNYLFGTQVGGLVGANNGSLYLSDSFAAGFAASTENSSSGIAAGLAVGSIQSATSCYSAVYYLGSTGFPVGEVDRHGTTTPSIAYTIYNVCESISSTPDRVFYIEYNGDTSHDPAGVTALASDISASELASRLNSSAFRSSGSGARPYSLMGQTLNSNFPFAALNSNFYQGDWSAAFQSGSLVYFEHYLNASDGSDAGYGFYGANVASTLKDSADYIVDGDGYGLVYLKGGVAIPARAHVKIKSSTSSHVYYEGDINLSESARRLVVSGSGTEYYVYPLDGSAVNFGYGTYRDAGSGYDEPKDFYLSATITTADDTEGMLGSPTYWFFNPHFAKSVEEAVSESSAVPDFSRIRLRTGRHLYNLSCFYVNYKAASEGKTYYQERDIDYLDYNWTSYTNATENVTHQEPIGVYLDSETSVLTVPFTSTYEGNCNLITGLSVKSTSGGQVGMFAINEGTLRNIVLTTDYDPSASSHLTVSRNDVLERGATVSMGVLAGENASTGKISNCAIAGYYLAGTEAALRVYSSSTVYAGGLVGVNFGAIANSSADTPRITVATNYANAYVGGFAGRNDGEIMNSYALGAMNTETPNSGAIVLAGFAADNGGLIRNSYCATSLTVGGVAVSYGFAPGGTVASCYYLNGGVYSYIDELRLYNNPYGVGTPLGYDELQSAAAQLADAAHSFNHPNTGDGDSAYPFNATVVDENEDFVHYGDWPLKANLGGNGIVYWEKEEGGYNAGYHVYALGYSGGVKITNDSLCVEHDDGGIITEYGYGYFADNDGFDDVTSSPSSALAVSSDYNAEASAALHEIMPEFTFHVYTTCVWDGSGNQPAASEGVYISNGSVNAQWTLTADGHTYVYAINPFFAASIQYVSSNVVAGATPQDNAPGTQANQYQIRSAMQLQYLNWNSYTHNPNESMNKGWFGNITTREAGSYATNSYAISFPYLGYAYASGTLGTGTTQHHSANYYWNQTHDVNAQMANDNSELFTPIGSIYDSAYASSLPVPLTHGYTAYFNGAYAGNSYQIRNVQIYSENEAVGLFGVVMGARIDGLILYSDNGNAIRTKESGVGWYNLGAVAGMAIQGGSMISKMPNYDITNCTASGYLVEDSRSNHGFGGANVGGFAGLSNLSMTNVSAVNDVLIAINYNSSSRNVRVGGVVGAFRGAKLQNCYSGGSVTRRTSGSTGGNNSSTNVNVGGIVGGWFIRTAGNLDTLIGTLTSTPAVTNCYTYVDLSAVASPESLCPVVTNANTEYPGCSFNTSNCYYFKPSPVTYVNRNSGGDGASDSAGKAIEITYNQLSYDERYTEGSVPAISEMTAAERTRYLISGRSLLDRLGGGFKTVTITEQSGSSEVRIDGKYTFPSSSELVGRNYPFPTVLKQTDSTHGTVNVHYGDWPTVGLQWDSTSLEVDILSALDTSDTTVSRQGSAKLQTNLNWCSRDTAPANVALSIKRIEDGADAFDAFVSDLSGSWSDNVRTLTLWPRKPGVYRVTASTASGGITYEDSITVTVTAELEVAVDTGSERYPTTLRLAENETAQISLLATSADGNVSVSPSSNCTWVAAPEDAAACETQLSTIGPAGAANLSTDRVTNYLSEGSTLVRYTASFRYVLNGTATPSSTEALTLSNTAILTVQAARQDTITYTDAGPYGGAATTLGTGTVADGDDYTVVDPADMPTYYGFRLGGWRVVSGTAIPTAEDGLFHAGDVFTAVGDVTLEASWIGAYKLTLLAPNSSVSQQIYYDTAPVSASSPLNNYQAPTASGYVLAGWYTSTGQKVLNADGTLAAAVSGYTTNSAIALDGADKSLEARWFQVKTVYVRSSDSTPAVGATVLITAESGTTVNVLTHNNGIGNTARTSYSGGSLIDYTTGEIVGGTCIDDVANGSWYVAEGGGNYRFTVPGVTNQYLYINSSGTFIKTYTVSIGNSANPWTMSSSKWMNNSRYLRYNSGWKADSSSSNASTITFWESRTVYDSSNPVTIG